MPPLKRLKEAVRFLREDRGLTLDQLAERAEFSSRARLAEVLRGNPTADTIDRILDALSADLHDLADAVDVVSGSGTKRGGVEDALRQLERVIVDQSIEIERLKNSRDGPKE